MWAQALSGVAFRHPRQCPRHRDHEGMRAPRASLWDESCLVVVSGLAPGFPAVRDESRVAAEKIHMLVHLQRTRPFTCVRRDHSLSSGMRLTFSQMALEASFCGCVSHQSVIPFHYSHGHPVAAACRECRRSPQ